MNRQELIARKMVKKYPIIIAKKNHYKDKGHPSFEGWAEKENDNANKEDFDIAKKSENLLKKNPFAFIVGCQFNRGRKAWQAWRAPYLIANDEEVGLKNMKPSFFAKLHERELAKIIRRNNLGSHFLSHNRAAHFLKLMAQYIEKNYDGKTEHIWKKCNTFEDLLKRIDDLPGFGIGLTNMTVKILILFGMIPQIPKTKESKKYLQVKPDINVQRVFYRTGLSKFEKATPAMDAAKKYMPDFPMLLDNGGYQIGMDFCHKSDPVCNDCPLYKKGNNEALCRRRGV